MEQFSVLMSLYIKEKPEYFKECMDSVLVNTVLPNEIVIVLDGPITDELRTVLDDYVNRNPGLYKIVPLEKNQGLGLALREGVLHCSNELIARMDTDDICRKDRFELQLKEFKSDPNLDICGGQILEFYDNPENPIGERKVPFIHEDIVGYQKTRSAFNHMTVMYRKSKVIEAGNYKHYPLMEDDILWVDMILCGSKCANTRDYLCLVRTNIDMVARRGGLKYYKYYKLARKSILKTGFITKTNYLKTNFVQLLVCLAPRIIRKWIFFGLLHRRSKRI